MQVFGEVPQQYADFAEYAAGDSACLEQWAVGVAADPAVVAWLERLPEAKRQPNLVFAAARWHGVSAPGPYDALRDALLGDDAAGGPIEATILARATQTNEVGRLATLVPAFARVARGRSLSLVEVGASAGLCLYPDRWSYAWSDASGTHRAGDGAGPLTCLVTGRVPYPVDPVVVAHRVGIDLHPLDVGDEASMAWLEMLVWPEHDDRRALLQRAVEIARADPPTLVTGDLLAELPRAVEEAAAHGEVVVFHSAVIAYLTEPDRQSFHDLMTGLVADGACHWVSNEGRQVLPAVTATGPDGVPSGSFVLGIDGRAVAWTHGHGRTMAWFG